MKKIATIAALFALYAAMAQRLPDASMVGGVSGQFFVSARSSSTPGQSKELAVEPNMVTLQPALTAVSCERTKQELLRLLGMRDQWQGKIFVTLQAAQSTDDCAVVAPERFAGNWNYGVWLPDVVDRDRFVEAVVRVCLVEIANRNATSRSTEIPEWLVQGFTRQLIGASAEPLVLAPPDEKVNGLNVKRLRVELSDNPMLSGPNMRKMNPLADAIATIHTNSPLSFDELSWPTDEELSGSERDIFNSSAQLFVAELLRLKNGPASLRTMLGELSGHLNWQLAFLDAFHGTFESALDVEKWWSLELVQFSGRDLLHLWTPEESWRQMDAFFRFPIDVQIGPGAPMRTEIKFQTIIRGWSRARQLEMLKQKLWDLDLLRMHLAPEFIPLVDDYRRVLQGYYNKRFASGHMLPQSAPLMTKAVEEAVQQLDALDDRRAAMRPEAQAPVASTVEPAPANATP